MSVVDVLRIECSAVARLGRELTPEDFSIPTRCEPWDMKDLLAHMLRALRRIPTALETSPSGPPDTDGVSYFTAYDPAADAQRIADHAIEIAGEFESGAALVDDFVRLADECFKLGSSARLDQVIELPWKPRMRLGEFLKTRVLEIVVHGIDMTDALGRSPVATAAGVHVVVEILDGLLDSPPVSELGWKPADYIRKGTGRSALSADEREKLGSKVELFEKLR